MCKCVPHPARSALDLRVKTASAVRLLIMDNVWSAVYKGRDSFIFATTHASNLQTRGLTNVLAVEKIDLEWSGTSLKGSVVKPVQRAIYIPRREHVIPALQIALCVLLQATVSTAPPLTILKKDEAADWSWRLCNLVRRAVSNASLAEIELTQDVPWEEFGGQVVHEVCSMWGRLLPVRSGWVWAVWFLLKDIFRASGRPVWFLSGSSSVDVSSRSCQECDHTCKECSGSSRFCLSCRDGYFLLRKLQY